MKVKIEIECDTIREIGAHLSVISMGIRKETKRLNLSPNEDEFPKSIKFDDDNCYGEHHVKITVQRVSKANAEEIPAGGWRISSEEM